MKRLDSSAHKLILPYLKIPSMFVVSKKEKKKNAEPGVHGPVAE
jgi:hypothetical protein